MRVLKPSWKFLMSTPERFQEELLKIEFAYRECYKSEGKMTATADKGFIRNKIAMGHLSPLEHSSISVEIICDRGVSHELVRHRIASFSQESTRYCNYSNGGLDVIEPPFWSAPGVRNNTKYNIWLQAMKDAERAYLELIAHRATPQEARSVLPNSTKTAIVVTQNLRQWRHFFQLRAIGTTGAPHPQMLEIAVPMFKEFKQLFVPIFDDLEMK
jgi:thymidylate synthase (FAD)